MITLLITINATLALVGYSLSKADTSVKAVNLGQLDNVEYVGKAYTV